MRAESHCSHGEVSGVKSVRWPTCSLDAPWFCQGPVCGDTELSCTLGGAPDCGQGCRFLPCILWCLTNCDLPVALELPKTSYWGDSMVPCKEMWALQADPQLSVRRSQDLWVTTKTTDLRTLGGWLVGCQPAIAGRDWKNPTHTHSSQ